MPNPFIPKQGLVAVGGKNIILQRPSQAASLGAICAAWGEIDNIFSDIFNLITFSKIEGISHTGEDISKILYSYFRSNSARFEVIENIIKARYSQNALEGFKKLSAEVKKKSKARNVLVHSEWRICDEYPEDLIITGSPEWIKYTKKDFLKILSDSNQARDMANDYFIFLSHQKRKEI